MTERVRWRGWALLAATAAWGTGFACVPDYAFNDTGADAGDAAMNDAAPRPDTSMPDVAAPDGARDASDASDAAPAPFHAQIFVKPNDLGGGTQGGMCALRNGTLSCWGDYDGNHYGELGLPPIDASNPYLHPMPVTTMGTPMQMVMGTYHTCSLYARAAWCRGSNDGTQLGNASVSGSTPNEVPVINAPPLDVIAASSATTCGVVLDGYDAGSGISNVWCWGYNLEGECGRPVNDPRDPNKAWPLTGDIDGGPAGLITDAVAIAGGGSHFCVLTARRTIECWGGNDSFESGPVPSPSCGASQTGRCSPQPQEVTLPNGEVPTEIALGDAFSCALAQSGSVYCWGSNQFDQLANGGAATQTCKSKDGTVSWPCNPTPTKIVFANAAPAALRHIFAGSYNACAIDAAQQAYCWGNDYAGEYGNGSMGANDPFAHLVNDMTSVKPILFDEMAMGGFKVCGRSGTTEYCWGGGNLGTQVGDAAPTYTWPAPVQF